MENMKCDKCGDENISVCPPYKTGEIIRFGGYDWQILDAQSDKALIISRDVIELRPYDLDFTDETWETCDLREYLNGTFLQRFSPEDRARIITSEIRNDANPWYETRGGNDTEDEIFLLSLMEADMLFADGEDFLSAHREFDFDVDKFVEVERGSGNGGFFSNAHDAGRLALYNGNPACWWLRSPGSHESSAAFIFDNGAIGVLGLDLNAILDVGGAGVRPALWLKL